MGFIKFRAWNTKTKEWLFDFRIHPDGSIMAVSKSLAGKLHHYETSTEKLADAVLVQSTEMPDKAGHVIFEGDLVDFGGIKYVIKRMNAALWAVNPDYPDHELQPQKCAEMTVLSSTFENPITSWKKLNA